MMLWINLLIAVCSFLLGYIVSYSYGYYRDMREFNKRQERYKKMM